MLAERLAVEFYYSGRLPTREYQIPSALRAAVDRKRIAVVDDAINAGWAIRSTCTDLVRHGGVPVVAAALLASAGAAARIASDLNIPLHSIAPLPGHLWTPEQCPLCVAGMPLVE
jgi:orotate phosphoribosyltransferase